MPCCDIEDVYRKGIKILILYEKVKQSSPQTFFWSAFVTHFRSELCRKKKAESAKPHRHSVNTFDSHRHMYKKSNNRKKKKKTCGLLYFTITHSKMDLNKIIPHVVLFANHIPDRNILMNLYLYGYELMPFIQNRLFKPVPLSPQPLLVPPDKSIC